MAVTNGYCTLAEAKTYLNIADNVDDTPIEDAINGVSRQIDGWCGRRFYVNSADETRYYEPDDNRLWFPDDIVSITTLKSDDDTDGTFETTWTVSTDYDLLPYNAALKGWPYTAIQVSNRGTKSFPKVRKGVQIVGKFGFPAVPSDVKSACLLQLARIYQRRDTPLGAAGNAQVGFLRLQSELDPDVKAKLERYWQGV